MRRQLAIMIAAAAVATPLSAQSDANRQHHGIEAPRAPQRRGHPDAAPEWERGREHAAVPYVRGDRWYGNPAPNDPRFRLDRPYEHGRFALVGPSHVHTVLRVDLVAHRVWLPGGYGFEIAAWDYPFTGSWCWDCGNQFVIYDDPDHPGWYLLLDVRSGEYVHVQYLGL